MEAVQESVEKIIHKYHQVRNQTLQICAPLLPEDHVVQPITDVSPPKWHLAHTTWFFEAFVLKRFDKNYRVFDPDYNYLFNSYYESIGERHQRVNRGNLTRPSVSEIQEYRRYVDVFMLELLERNKNQALFSLTELGLQHEQQHQELLFTDIKYILGTNPIYPEYKKIHLPTGAKSTMEFISIPEGFYNKGFEGAGFSYDIESPFHKVYVNSFSIANRLITNGEYLEFIQEGGYKDFRHWSMDGWETVKSENWQQPLYWIKKEGELFEYTLGGLKPLAFNLPVTHISFYEADAYAKWAGKRLLTEDEWEAAAQYLNQNAEEGNFMSSGYLQPINELGNIQLLGNAWQWTYSAFHPYPGYKREAGALGEYNGKFMINQMVLKGGSCVTPKDHIRTSYRNFFPPEKRWQFTGIRLASDE